LTPEAMRLEVKSELEKILPELTDDGTLIYESGTNVSIVGDVTPFTHCES
jgi:hypothetical protein